MGLLEPIVGLVRAAYLIHLRCSNKDLTKEKSIAANGGLVGVFENLATECLKMGDSLQWNVARARRAVTVYCDQDEPTIKAIETKIEFCSRMVDEFVPFATSLSAEMERALEFRSFFLLTNFQEAMVRLDSNRGVGVGILGFHDIPASRA